MLGGTDLGCIELGGTLVAPVLITDGAETPKDPAALPGFRVYGQGPSSMPGGTGSLAKLDTGNVTDASNAAPIQITSAGHNLQTGTGVVVAGVAGNTAANGQFTVTRVSDDAFTLDASTGNSAYVSGGVWHVAGLYFITLAVLAGNGYEEGQTYTVLVSWTVASVPYSAAFTFQVV